MSTQPYVDDESRSIKRTLELMGSAAATARSKTIHTTRSVTLKLRSPNVDVADQPWRLGIGALAIIIPAILLTLTGPNVPLTTPGIIFLVAVAFSTYVADWVGGLTSLTLSAVMLDLLFVGRRLDFGLPSGTEESVSFAVTLGCGAILILLIQRIKIESLVDRRAAMAARAATTALESVETAATLHALGATTSRETLHRSLLRAMVTINRAHFGALFLVNQRTGSLETVASYGMNAVAHRITSPESVGQGFVSTVAQERRVRSIADISADRKMSGSLLDQMNARAVVGVPLIDAADQLLGVAIVGLLVPHRHMATEIARLEAFATRASAVLQAAVGIDERESALHSATEATRWLDLVIAAMPEAVVLALPPSGQVVAANQAANALLGHLTGEDGPVDILSRLSFPEGEPLDLERCPIQQAFRTGEVVTGVEMIATNGDGQQVPVLMSAAPIHDDDGPVVGVVAVFRDIVALKEAARLKDEFVSVVSHELRSPLTPIRGFVQLVARDLAREGGHDPQVSRLNSIAGHVDRMTRLVDDLLDVSRLKSGSLEIRRGETDLAELCQDVIRDRTSTAATHQIVLTTDTPITGNWDADRLYQVIDNLVGNALKYSPPGGTISVRTGRDEASGSAWVSVADDGPGISATDKERIFGAFYRTREAAASQIAGLGLGLYICHELVAAHGGTIEVTDAPDGGAAFTVRLPLLSEAVAA